MSNTDHLGDALREQLHALVAEVKPSTELWASVDAIPETERRFRWRDRLTWRRLAVTVPVPVAAAVAAVLAFGGATPTASLGTRITWLPNGQVRMPDVDVARVGFANSVLRRAHFPETVIPMTDSCRDRDWSYSAEYIHPTIVNLYIPSKELKRWVVLEAAEQVGPNELMMAVGRFRRGSHLPTCASSHGWGAGVTGAGFKSWPAPRGQSG